MHSSIINKRIILVVGAQIVIIFSALALSYALRFDLKVPPDYLVTFWSFLPALMAIKMVVFFKMGLFRGWWRYVSMHDLMLS